MNKKGKDESMKRIDKIYKYIKERSSQYNIGQLQGRVGLAAAEISDQLNILRNNVSMELNILFKMGKIIKIKGRPVLYFDKQVLENLCGVKLAGGSIEIHCMEEIVKTGESAAEKSPFQYLIGADGSLKKQVEQAKAAVFYPPNGLHTLIVGQTGVGKTLFANIMYEYGKYVKKFAGDAPFIIFNCADFYNNPQLLMSQLFGHTKGAFTGADSDKKGLVERADSGVLFLDEIHRLPPEGQEMIFYFMDTGTFSRLGETTRKRRANVLIIGATTEDYTSALIKTFIRRIPNIITIPPLQDRSLKERLDIIKFLLSNEARRINKPVKITAEVVKSFLGSISYGGNIGQLKSNIQLACAKAFLNGMHNQRSIEIDFKVLPDHIKNGLLAFGTQRKETEELSKYLDEQTVTIFQGHKELVVEDSSYELPFNLYKIIEDKVALLKNEGIDDEYIKKFLYADINSHIKSFYNKFNIYVSARQKILKIVDKNVLEFAEEIQQLAKQRLQKNYNDRFLYALSLHISAMFKRLSNNQTLQYTDLESVINEYPNEFKVALEIKERLEARYHIEVPKAELEYFTLLLSSIQEAEQEGEVAIIVVAHGNSTASSMVEVVQKLLGYSSNIAAIDMPLEVSHKDILDKIIGKVQELDKGKGVLLLVDMGMINFDVMIMEKVNCRIKTVDMVSTPLVLEAARRANLLDMDLDSIYDSLKKFKGYEGMVEEYLPEYSNEVIVTICTSGEGTAVKLKQLVEEILANITDKRIPVLPVSAHHLRERIREIQAKHTILASIGAVNPDIAAPFIPLESLINGRGEKILMNIIKNGGTVVENDRAAVVKNLSEDSLKQFLTYLNPAKVISVLITFQSVLEKKLQREFSNAMKIKLIIHCGCALERMVINEGLVYKGEKDKLHPETIQCIKKAAEVFTDTLSIDLTDDEIFYIAEML